MSVSEECSPSRHWHWIRYYIVSRIQVRTCRVTSDVSESAPPVAPCRLRRVCSLFTHRVANLDKTCCPVLSHSQLEVASGLILHAGGGTSRVSASPRVMSGRRRDKYLLIALPFIFTALSLCHSSQGRTKQHRHQYNCYGAEKVRIVRRCQSRGRRTLIHRLGYSQPFNALVLLFFLIVFVCAVQINASLSCRGLRYPQCSITQ